CDMSSQAMAPGPRGAVLAAWENMGRVYWAKLDPKRDDAPAPQAPPGDAKDRKHPAVASDADGRVIVAWAEGTGWEKGGSVAWQVYQADGTSSGTKYSGRARGLPVWSMPAVFARRGGGFVVMY